MVGNFLGQHHNSEILKLLYIRGDMWEANLDIVQNRVMGTGSPMNILVI